MARLANLFGTLDFDTEHPEAARAKLTIDLDSIDAGSEDANTELQKPAWFDTTAYPVGDLSCRPALKTWAITATSSFGSLTLRGLPRR